MTTEALGAVFAQATGKVDLPYHPFTDQVGWSFAYLTNKLVPRHTLEPHIALENLPVGGTDSRQVDTDEGSVTSYLWCGIRFIQL